MKNYLSLYHGLGWLFFFFVYIEMIYKINCSFWLMVCVFLYGGVERWIGSLEGFDWTNIANASKKGSGVFSHSLGLLSNWPPSRVGKGNWIIMSFVEVPFWGGFGPPFLSSLSPLLFLMQKKGVRWMNTKQSIEQLWVCPHNHQLWVCPHNHQVLNELYYLLYGGRYGLVAPRHWIAAAKLTPLRNTPIMHQISTTSMHGCWLPLLSPF